MTSSQSSENAQQEHVSSEQHEQTRAQWERYVAASLARSPLYASLYAQLRTDSVLYSVMMQQGEEHQPIQVLFFAVVNFLLLRDTTHELAQFYPYLHTPSRPAKEAYPFFREFCLSHLDEIRKLLSGARLQTNEVTRCANLLPAFEIVSKVGGRQPLALFEIGASAGLNLNWNRFGYHYGSITIGDPNSSVQIQCELEGNSVPPLPETFPVVSTCQGIELFPLDIHNEVDVRWLRACIWPEEIERYQCLAQAIALAKQYPPMIHSGDACELLPSLLAAVPPDETLCLWHSYALRQGPVHVRESIEHLLRDVSMSRPVYRVSLEAQPVQGGRPRLELHGYEKGAHFFAEHLANCSLHGERMEWCWPN